MEPFTNNQIETTSLPKHEAVVYTSLDAKYKNILYINLGVLLLVMSIGTGFFLYFNEEARIYWYFFLILIFVIGLLLFTLFTISFQKKGYALREKDILYKSGILATSITIIPFNRIQHVSTHEGILSRMYHLSQLQIFTAGGSSSDLNISGIPKLEAEKMRAFLIQEITDEVIEENEKNEIYKVSDENVNENE